MDWKVIFLAFLILSSITVTSAVVAQNKEVIDAFGTSPPKLYLYERIQLEPIDADGPGG